MKIDWPLICFWQKKRFHKIDIEAGICIEFVVEVIPGPVFSYKLRYIVGFWLVEIAISPCTRQQISGVIPANTIR